MDPALGPKSRRGRKRKKNDEHDVTVDCNGRSNGVKTRSLKLVNRYVKKEFQGSGIFLGRITLYDSFFYRINYEDGDSEDLDCSEVKKLLVETEDLTGEWLERKQKLDKLLLYKDVNAKFLKSDYTQEQENAHHLDPLLFSEMNSDDAGVKKLSEVDYACKSDVVADCSIDSCEDIKEGYVDLDMEVPLVPPPELPSSSGHIGVPEEHVSHLLSVYSFLRSFSVQLFLYPFEMDDFVGALNCSVANTLLDCVHVALLRVLKRHLERLSSDGSELATKCLRCLDWTLLDTLTWPIYLVHYIMLMDNRNRQDWKEFCIHSLERDYYCLPAGKKLVVMQVLCEGVLDSEELRIEIDHREESEVGMDMDTNSTVITCNPRRARPGHPKFPSSKDIEGAHNREINPALDSHYLESQVGRTVGNSLDEDENGDECRLCGMDGLLVCCDGCPSAYHSRCLGLNKMFMPDGSWYCPECKINATEPKVLRGTALRGGYIFGIDPYEQVFVASCDHLLVLKASINSEVCLRYYNRHDIPRVLHAFYSKQDHVIAYSEICRGIIQYWEIPQDGISCNEIPEFGLHSAHKDITGECNTQLVNLLDNFQNHESCVTGVCANMSASSRHQSGIIMTTTKTKPASFNSLIGQSADLGEINRQSTSSSVTETASCVSRSSDVKFGSPMNRTSLEPKASIPCQELSNKDDRIGSHSDNCFYKGSSFRPTGYINYYLHGDFAATAAANLAVLYSEENQAVSGSSVDNRKVLSASFALQVKALSSAATRFFWPNTEKKLVEAPRERCGWCFSCKATISSKRGCLLNAAVSNATRGSMKVMVGLRPVKNGDGRLTGIAAYLLFMEESLNGLLFGPFLNDTSRKQWRKQVDQAASCNAIKILLLELEENIRTIALYGEWTKIVEGSSSQSSISQIAATSAGSSQKRKLGRRGKKPSATVEIVVDISQDKKKDFTWWRGGRLPKLMFRRGILPCSIMKKSARQGGSKEILGVLYGEGNDTPKSSKQLAWRSAVEMSRNMAQFALQVRYLDFHLRWGDLNRPEQNNCDGKGPETEAHAFRNAFICDKKIVGHEIRYSVAFGSQKQHMPSRVMKNITEVEQISGEGKERYWFSETYIPLYLIKEYEQKVEQNKPVVMLSKLRRRRSKASGRNIFSDLWWKQDNIVRSCCSCHQDVFYRNFVKCSKCEEFCHEHCATSPEVNTSKEVGRVEFLITCNKCQTPSSAQVQITNGPLTSPLRLQHFPKKNPPSVTKGAKSVGSQGSSASVKEHNSEVKSTNRFAVVKKGRKLTTGLIWRKNNCEDTGIDFRLRNILLRGDVDTVSIKPVCRLCNQLYNADLMYIRCETCQHWFHADAVELDESKIFQLVGFKCSKCRRIKSPICPYLDPEKKKALEDRMVRKLAAKHELLTTDSDPREKINDSTVSSPGPRKLPVRRHMNEEKKDVSNVKLAVMKHLMSDSKKISGDSVTPDHDPPVFDNVGFETPRTCTSTVIERIKSDFKKNSDDGVTLDHDSLACDHDVAFEPPTNQDSLACDDMAFEPPTNQDSLACDDMGFEPPTMNHDSVACDDMGFEPQTYHDSVACDDMAFEPPTTNHDDPLACDDMGFVPPTMNQDSVACDDMAFEPPTNQDSVACDDMAFERQTYDDSLDCGDMGFEPQTYISFNELIASDDDDDDGDGHVDGVGNTENILKKDEEMENRTLRVCYDEEPIVRPTETRACKICRNKTEASLDLYCQVCGIWIHRRCSPWFESSSTREDGWRCGGCREWR